MARMMACGLRKLELRWKACTRPFLRLRAVEYVYLSLRIFCRRFSQTSPKFNGANLLISLTSYPARIDGVVHVLRSLIAQTVRAEALVLCLSSDQFPGQESDLPRSIRKMVDRRDVQILWQVGDIRSYKKLLPTLDMYPGKTIITVDDDTFYPRNLIEDLMHTSSLFPGCIVGTRGKLIRCSDVGVEEYLSWGVPKPHIASYEVFLTGVGGILYPPNSLCNRVTEYGLAYLLSPTADDIWFKAMSVLASTRSVTTLHSPSDFYTVRGTQSTSLTERNVLSGENDVQVRAMLQHFGADLVHAMRPGG